MNLSSRSKGSIFQWYNLFNWLHYFKCVQNNLSIKKALHLKQRCYKWMIFCEFNFYLLVNVTKFCILYFSLFQKSLRFFFSFIWKWIANNFFYSQAKTNIIKRFKTNNKAFFGFPHKYWKLSNFHQNG